MTRPEPTIIGNCDSWSFIVGKNAMLHSVKRAKSESLQRSNIFFIHNLFTIILSKF